MLYNYENVYLSTLQKNHLTLNPYIRPHIEYCVQTWSPYYAKDIDMLEKMQHRTIKLVPQLANIPYEKTSKI